MTVSNMLFSGFLMPAADLAAARRTEMLSSLLVETLPPDDGFREEITALASAVSDTIGGRSVILQLAPGLSDDRREAVRSFLENLLRLTATLPASRQEAAIARLAEIILPDDLAAARGTLAADNLAVRDRFVAETGPLTSIAVAEQAGHSSNNKYATAARWKKSGEIFSVHHRGVEYFPAFQFRDGRPHPTIKQILPSLPPTLSAWQRAFWFVSTNGWLDGKPPIDLLDDPAVLVAAAGREAQELVG